MKSKTPLKDYCSSYSNFRTVFLSEVKHADHKADISGTKFATTCRPL